MVLDDALPAATVAEVCCPAAEMGFDSSREEVRIAFVQVRQGRSWSSRWAGGRVLASLLKYVAVAKVQLKVAR